MKNRIKQLRRHYGLTQVRLAELCGCHWTTIKNIECSKKQSIQFRLLEELCRALSCSLDEIFIINKDEKNDQSIQS